MGLHKATSFNIQDPHLITQKTLGPLSFTSNHSVYRLFTAHSRLSSLGNSVASAPFNTAAYVRVRRVLHREFSPLSQRRPVY
jgi:hypothetical protein